VDINGTLNDVAKEVLQQTKALLKEQKEFIDLFSFVTKIRTRNLISYKKDVDRVIEKWEKIQRLPELFDIYAEIQIMIDRFNSFVDLDQKCNSQWKT